MKCLEWFSIFDLIDFTINKQNKFTVLIVFFIYSKLYKILSNMVKKDLRMYIG